MNKLKRFLALVLAMSMMLTAVPFGVFAADDAPAITGTTDAPFKQGTGESNSFRIPAMVTLSDGTLVAAADARWNTTYDGGGLDTMVAISTDNGGTWTHSFANYLGDNGNAYNGSSSTAFIDPALAVTSNDTIYMLVDLYPYGIALNGNVAAHPNTDTGFTDDGYLKLDYNSADTYDYYLKDGEIYQNGSTEPLNGYTVDEHFNYTDYWGNSTNLFFADSIFKVARTGFLYLTKSNDGGESWSAPQLLNLKNGTERVCLVGPGRGLVTKNGTIVFPVYSFPGDPTNTNAYTQQRMGFIYSTDGTNWQRSANLDYQWASESAVVELNDGTLRFFFRNGEMAVMYVDYNMTAKTWGTPVNTGVASNSNCQVSAISLNHTVDGKQVILVSCPQGATTAGDNNSSASARLNGKIHLFTVGESNALTKVSTVDVPSVHSTNSFMYSCLTAQKDAAGNETGDISILYEDQESQWGTGDNCYYQMSFKTFDVEKSFGVTLEGAVTRETVDVTLKVGETVNKTIEGVVLNGEKEDTYAKVTWAGTEATPTTYATATLGTNASYTGEPINVADCLYTFTETSDGVWSITGTDENGATVYLYPGNGISGGTASGYPHTTTPPTGLEVYVTAGGETGSFYISSNLNVWNNGKTTYLNFTRNAYRWNRNESVDATNCSLYLYREAVAGETSSNEIPGYVKVTSLDDVSSGGKYLITAPGTDGKTYVAYPSTSEDSLYSQIAKVTGNTATSDTATDESTTVTITGKAVGETSVEVGSTTYNITVTRDFKKEVDVELNVGESKTLTDITGNYEASYTSDGLNEAIAIVDVKGTSTEGGIKIEEISSITSGNTYAIRTTSDKYLTADGTETSDPAQAAKWTITYDSSQGGYIATNNGKYLTYDYSSGKFSASSESWYAEYFTVNGNTLKAYDFSIWGYTDVAEALEISVTDPVDTTDITFTGVAAGKTTAYVGDTKYNITVNPAGIDHIVDIELEIGEDFTYTDTTGNYVDHAGNTAPDSTYATMAVAGTTNSTQKKLVPVTSATFETGKRYVIENVRAKGSQSNNSVLTSTEVADGATTALSMNGPLDVASSQTWTFTPSDNMYYVGRNNEYLHISGSNATMDSTVQELSLEYVAGSGWLIYYNQDRNNTSNDGDYFLSDLYGTGSTNAYGYITKNDDGNYWNIYEVVEETLTDATKVTFTGVAEGKTVATVGTTQYNITVVPAEVDDEVLNSATDIWTVDPEVQRNKYNSIIAGKAKDLYTDDSWKQYETARQAAYKKLAEVTNAKYTSKAAADEALAELKAAVDALETAAGKLVSATTISVHYTYNGTDLDIREYKIASSETSVTLPDTIVVKDVAYKVTDTTLERQGAETTYYVPVELIGKVGEGFVASGDIKPGELTYNDHSTICDLVDDSNVGKKITEMTVTVGISYDLDLGIEMKDGYTVEWVSDNTSIATVDQNGLVTAVGEGVTNITATVKDAAGNIVEVNSIPVTVFPKGTGDRTVAIYIENVDNTTVWCVVNGDTDTRAFEVVEGELVYGQFDTTVSDNTKTTAMSFFGAPDEAHALVYMKSTNSDDHYFQLHDKDGNLGVGVAGYLDNVPQYYYVSNTTSGAGYWQALGLNDNNNPDWDKIKDMVQWAIDKDCDGGLGFTRRQNEGALGSSLSFKSDPMPRIEKVVDGVLPTSRKQADYRRYTDGMVAAVHELVYFKITVTQEVPTEWTDADQTVGAIVYENAWVRDTVLPGAYLYNKADDEADGTYDGEISEANRKKEIEITEQLNSAWTDQQKADGKRSFNFYLMYEIQESDIPKFYIDNIANLDYMYGSKYSTGAQAAAADAEARISVVGTAIDDVVIDFGQSFVYEGHDYTCITDDQSYTFEGLSNTHLKGAYVEGENDIAGITASKATAKYGTVKVYRTATGGTDDKGYPEYTYTVTYTPTQILQNVDTVLIYGYGDNNQEKIINGFLVYPATTVYYEEGFILSDGQTWNDDNAKKATVNQTFELLGDSQFNTHGELTGKVSNKKNAYGFDPIYDGVKSDTNLEVEKSYISSNTIGDKTSFTFTGNGFEIFADCTTSTGRVSVQVKNSAGERVKIFNVNTIVAERLTETGDSTDGQNTDFDSLPIVSWHTTIHDTYTVTITKIMDTDTVMIDGVRVFNTVNERKYDNDDGTPNSPFSIDLEDAPEFFQLRDYVLSALVVKDDTSVDYGTVQEMAGQVYDQVTSEGEAPAVILAKSNGYYTGTDEVQNLLDNGPKNELYLHRGETLVFSVTTSRIMQVGLKAPVASTTYSISYEVDGVTTTPANNVALNTSVDMFYELKNSNGAAKTYTITITNNGNEILSVTDLKICDDPNAAFVALTVDDIKTALEVMGYSDSCEAGHSFENGFCTVCGMGSVRNTTTGVEYGTVGEALAAAKDGEIVILLTDCTESTAMVTSGVTLDLNGFQLTASYAVAMDGAHIIDSTGNGSLVIGEKALILDEENTMIPVYNGEGYVFTKAGFAVRQDTAYTGEGIKINAMAYPVQMAVVDLLKNGGADNNIEIVIRLTWDTDQGTGSQDFKFTDEVVSSVYSSNQGAWNKYSKMFSMVVTGFESIENLKANIIVVSGTDAEYVSSTSVDIT